MRDYVVSYNINNISFQHAVAKFGHVVVKTKSVNYKNKYKVRADTSDNVLEY